MQVIALPKLGFSKSSHKYTNFSNLCISKWKPTTLFIEAYLKIRLRIWKIMSQPPQIIDYHKNYYKNIFLKNHF